MHSTATPAVHQNSSPQRVRQVEACALEDVVTTREKWYSDEYKPHLNVGSPSFCNETGVSCCHVDDIKITHCYRVCCAAAKRAECREILEERIWPLNIGSARLTRGSGRSWCEQVSVMQDHVRLPYLIDISIVETRTGQAFAR